MKFTIYQASQQGQRRHNQDRVAYSYSKDALLTVLADGMGGHRNGEIAAQFAIEVLTDAFQRMALPTLANPSRFLEQYIRQVHDAIDRHALLSDLPEPPRTTIVAALVQRDALYCAHAGDSRLYHFRNGELLFRTEDHSKVQLLFRKGMIRKEQMLTHPERNKIYNCVGGEEPPRVELAARRALREGDTVLLCSDGLWSLLAEEEIAAILQNGPVVDTVPVLFELAAARADQNCDDMSAIAFTWGAHAYQQFSISTALMPLDLNTTILDFSPAARGSGRAKPGAYAEVPGDDDVERVIAEIHAALDKCSK